MEMIAAATSDHDAAPLRMPAPDVPSIWRRRHAPHDEQQCAMRADHHRRRFYQADPEVAPDGIV